MKKYLVGGAVRDAIMGIDATDRDWVVVGSKPEEMLGLGFVQVGADFPVFLHPKSQEEYALARTERKTGAGYQGFVVHADESVTIEEDLSRRDLSMNAIAMADDGTFVDPFNGQDDIKNKIIRHVSPAFKEDPVRILRVARFAARYSDFTVHESTMEFMREMVANGEVDSLVPERVWKELCKGLMTEKPSRMFEVLRDCGALAVIFPELNVLWGVPQVEVHHPEIDTGIHTMMVIDKAAACNASLTVRYACLVHDLGKGTTPKDMLPRHLCHEVRSERLVEVVGNRFKVQKDITSLALLVAREHTNIHRGLDLTFKALGRMLKRTNAYKNPQQFHDALLACEFDAQGRLNFEDRPYPQRKRLADALKSALAVGIKAEAAKAISKGLTGPQIGEFIDAARVSALRDFVKNEHRESNS